MTIVGIISDTHGLLRSEASNRLRGCDIIIHAGDIGSPDVIDQLELVAPVRAIRGNIDKGAWASAYPHDDVIEIGGKYIYVLHNLAELDLDPAAAGFHVVVSGHSHQPKIENKDGILFVNPGSAGPRRFTLPIAIAKLEIEDNEARARIEEIAA